MAKTATLKERAQAALDAQQDMWREVSANSRSGRMAFEEAVASLPDKAPVADEMDWIRSHPAMVRLAQSKDKTKEVTISAGDVLEVAHGPAPSKAAVFALIHWANSPHEFFKMVLSEHKKKTQADEQKKVEQIDVGLDEVAKLLKQVRLAKEESCGKSDTTGTEPDSMTVSAST